MLIDYPTKIRKLDINLSRSEWDDWENFWFTDVEDKVKYCDKNVEGR